MATDRPANALLQSLPAADWARLRGGLQPLELEPAAVLAEAGDLVEWVVFPQTGLISVISILASGVQVETSIVGCDGAVGLIESLGSAHMHSRLLVQIPGRAYRLNVGEFRAAFHASPGMQRAVLKQIELLQAASRVAIACHSLHSVEGRLCRWLLECQDLAGGANDLPLTQELLGVMLAVQRTTVSKFAGALQDAGLIRYSRGHIVIIDRKGLERGSCECRTTLQELKELMAPSTPLKTPGVPVEV